MALVLLLLATAFVAAAPAAARPAPACVDAVNSACPGEVCADASLDGKFQWEECIIFYCTTWGCPPPYEPMSGSSATCTGYVNVAGSKQRTCVDPTQAPECGAWTEGWSSPLGYFKSCYGTAACEQWGCALDTCNDTWCLHTLAVPTWLGVCTETTVGGTPVAVTVEHGTGVGCYGATYTTCRLSYYPGEPNTPVWVCTTKRVI